MNTTHDEIVIKSLPLETTDILKLKLSLVRDSWPDIKMNPTVPSPNSLFGLRFFYRGKELKNEVKLSECNFQTTFKDEEGLMQPLAVCLLSHTSKIPESLRQNGKEI